MAFLIGDGRKESSSAQIAIDPIKPGDSAFIIQESKFDKLAQSPALELPKADEEKLQTKPLASIIQRQEQPDEEEKLQTAAWRPRQPGKRHSTGTGQWTILV